MDRGNEAYFIKFFSTLHNTRLLQKPEYGTQCGVLRKGQPELTWSVKATEQATGV